MKITKPLDNILNTEVKVRILRFFCRTGAEWNGRQVAKEIGVTPKTAHQALNTLNKEKVLLLRNMGKTHVYSLNEGNFLVSKLLKPLFLKEDSILDHIIKAIKRKISSSKARKAIISIAIFGSVSKQEEHSSSDIDLAVLVKDAKAKASAERLFEEIGSRIAVEFGNGISPYINTRMEFNSKYKKGLPVVKNILKSHNLIYGERLEKLL
jgi:predicted nucleotidyltransferase